MKDKRPSFWMIIAAICLCLITFVSCGTNDEGKIQAEEKNISQEDSGNEENNNQQNTDETDETDEINEIDGAIEVGDIDGNGKSEKVVYTEIDGANGKLAFYFNNKKIYERDGTDTLPADIGNLIAYEDIDHDGSSEIILTMFPYVNSMPLIEYTVLKEANGTWKELEVYQGKNRLDNTFPISVIKGKTPYEVSISCAGLDKTIKYDAEKFYSAYLAENRELYEPLERNFLSAGEGEKCGRTSAWGVWNIQTDSFEGKPCIVAEQGIQGNDKYDIWGSILINFDYDENGKIRILDINFEEYQ